MIYVTGDLHGDLSRFKAPALKKLRKGDTLLVCGDFGFLWEGEQDKKEARILKKLGQKPYQIAFVDGIHENHALLASYPVTQWNGGKVHHITGGLYHLMRGQVYSIGDVSFFALGGGENPDADCRDERLEGCMPTPGELEEARHNLAKAENRVDYIITHDCTGTVRNFLNMDKNEHNYLYAFLNETAGAVSYKKWYFGRWHVDKSIPPKYMGVFQEVHALQ